MTPQELYKYYLTQYTQPTVGVSPVSPLLTVAQPGGSDEKSFDIKTPTKEESEYAMNQGMTDVGENKFSGLGSMILGGAVSALNPLFGVAYSLADPNSMTRQILGNIGFNPVTEGSIDNVSPFGGYNDFTGTEGTFTTDTSDTGASQDTSGPPGGTNASGGPGEDYATGGRVGYLQGGLISLLGNYYGKR